MSVNMKLRKRRREKDLTQQTMADLLGYRSKSGYNMIEIQRNHPPLRVAMKIAEILDCEISDVFDQEYLDQHLTGVQGVNHIVS